MRRWELVVSCSYGPDLNLATTGPFERTRSAALKLLKKVRPIVENTVKIDESDDARPFHEQTASWTDEQVIAALDVSRCEEHFAACVEFAKRSNRWTSDQGLRPNLERLIVIARRDGKPRLFKDFAPYSFEFSAGGLYGGLIFHGSHDGGGNGSAPTFSVCLTPTDGWSIHT